VRWKLCFARPSPLCRGTAPFLWSLNHNRYTRSDPGRMSGAVESPYDGWYYLKGLLCRAAFSDSDSKLMEFRQAYSSRRLSRNCVSRLSGAAEQSPRVAPSSCSSNSCCAEATDLGEKTSVSPAFRQRFALQPPAHGWRSEAHKGLRAV